MYLVLRHDNSSDAVYNIVEVTGLVPEISWDEPFWMNMEFIKFPWNIFDGRTSRALVLKHPDLVPGIAYYNLDKP